MSNTHKHAHIEKWYESLEERRTHTHTYTYTNRTRIYERKMRLAVRGSIEGEGEEKEIHSTQPQIPIKTIKSVRVCAYCFDQLRVFSSFVFVLAAEGKR